MVPFLGLLGVLLSAPLSEASDVLGVLILSSSLSGQEAVQKLVFSGCFVHRELVTIRIRLRYSLMLRLFAYDLACLNLGVADFCEVVEACLL